MQTNTNTVNKKWTLLQTTGGKDEPILGKQYIIYSLTNVVALQSKSLVSTTPTWYIPCVNRADTLALLAPLKKITNL